ncbi:MAG: SDR family NAD(P)-dependent oxidoreductase [Pseudomonadota bacterium]
MSSSQSTPSMLEAKTVLITGAAGALGQAAADMVETAGGQPVLLDLSFPEGFRPHLSQYEIDLTDGPAVSAVLSRIGEYDAIFNIAGGFAMGATAYDSSDDDWQKMMALNVDTVRHIIKAAVPSMVKRGRGAIVNVGAYAALSGKAEMSAYVASKSVVMRLTESLAEEVRAKGVNVNAVLPTILDTPANRAAMPDADPNEWVSPSRLASVMGFLASDGAADVHGALIPVRGLS